MMNAKYSAIVIFVCIVTPVVFGLFLWPTSEEDVTEWSTSTTNNINLTSGLTVTDVPNTSPYSGTNNNIYLFNYSQAFDRTSAANTSTPSTYVRWERVAGGALSDQTLDMPSGTNDVTYTDVWDHWEAYFDDNKDQSSFELEVLVWTGANIYFTYDDTDYPSLILFKNGRAQLYDASTGVMQDVSDVTFSYTRSSWTVQQFYQAVTDSYVDTTSGFVYDDTTGMVGGRDTWTNGYVNHKAFLLVKPSSSYNGYNKISVGSSTKDLYFWIGQDSNWYVAYTSSTPTASDYTVLGSTSAYSHLLIMPDSDYGKITVYALTTMSGFDQLYTDHLGNTVAYDYDGGAFTGIFFKMGTFNYWMASTVIESGTVKAIVDETVTPRDYYNDDEWTFVIKNPSVIGSSLSFYDGTTTTTYPITGGKISVVLGTDTAATDVSVRDMVIGHIYDSDTSTYTTYINGQEYAAGIEAITLGGTWQTSVYVSDVEFYTSHSYGWWGGFGLDMTGYCMVGLLTSVGMFLVFGLMNRRGYGDELAMLVAAISGLLYLYLAFVSLT